MLKRDLAKWNQTPEDLRGEAWTATHARTRERFLALCELTQQGHGVTAIARGTTHHAQTLMRWVHWYNEAGPDGVTFQHTGGLTPLIVLIEDGASYHRAVAVVDRAEELAITLLPLPSDSPDFMPVEVLWRWLREDAT
jgi:transposase-like protein